LDGNGRPFLVPDVIERLLSVFTSEIEARVVVVEGARQSFCMGQDPSGLDVQSTRPGETGNGATLERFATLLRSIQRSPRPVIALVSGPAHGGGLGLAAAADLVLATPSATFALPETLLGLVPAIVFPVAVRRIGISRARWIALGGATWTAAEAHGSGLVDEVTDDLEGTLARHLQRLARMDARAVAAVKRLAATHETSPQAYQAEAVGTFLQLLASDETRSRLRRFAAGSAPWLPEDEP
jgi:enoyl-CoA hydratase/carnithine racemase